MRKTTKHQHQQQQQQQQQHLERATYLRLVELQGDLYKRVRREACKQTRHQHDTKMIGEGGRDHLIGVNVLPKNGNKCNNRKRQGKNEKWNAEEKRQSQNNQRARMACVQQGAPFGKRRHFMTVCPSGGDALPTTSKGRRTGQLRQRQTRPSDRPALADTTGCQHRASSSRRPKWIEYVCYTRYET